MKSSLWSRTAEQVWQRRTHDYARRVAGCDCLFSETLKISSSSVKTVAEWTGFRALLLLGMWLCYLSIPIRLIESASLLACSMVPRIWFQGDNPHSASLKRKDRKARRWRLSARTPRVIIVAAVLTWTASAVGCGMLSYTLVAGMFTPYRMWHKVSAPSLELHEKYRSTSDTANLDAHSPLTARIRI